MKKPKLMDLPPMHYQWEWMLPSAGAGLKASIGGRWSAADAAQAATLLDMMKDAILAAGATQDAELAEFLAAQAPAPKVEPRASDGPGDEG